MIRQAHDIDRVIVIGAGVMGEGIAQSFAEAGLSVCLVDVEAKALTRCVNQIKANLDLSIRYDIISETLTQIMARISTTLADDLPVQLEKCDFVIETSPETIDVKQAVFAQLDKAPPEVLLTSNTSSFTISQITKNMQTPERVVGLHYFNPAHLIPAVEVHFGERTNRQAINEVIALMERIGKVPILVRKEIRGFIINRLTGALSREIDHMLDEGVVAPEDLDAAVKASLGFRLAQIGPMEGKDFIGLDTDVRVSRNVFPDLSNRTEPSESAVKLVEQGHFGLKTGRGYYDYKGQSRENLLHDRNIKLLEQRKLFLAMQAKNKREKDE